jgi:hypothetical protein
MALPIPSGPHAGKKKGHHRWMMAFYTFVSFHHPGGASLIMAMPIMEMMEMPTTAAAADRSARTWGRLAAGRWSIVGRSGDMSELLQPIRAVDVNRN